LPPAQHVQVQVIDALPAVGTAVDHHSVAAGQAQLLGELLDDQQQVSICGILAAGRR
jgi:hypothetical protein